jgi:hypothetical protein
MLTSSRTTLYFALLAVFGLLALSSTTANGQSRSLYMPVLSTDAGDSLLTITNPSTETVNVAVTARTYSGAVLMGNGIINPTSISLPASNTRALKATDLFGQSGLSGWVELQTASPAISGAFFTSDSPSGFDGTKLQSAPATRVIFAKATTDSLAANKFVLINTGSGSTGPIKLSAFENGGKLVAQRNTSLAAFSGVTGGVTDLLPNLRSFDGYIVAEALAASSQAGLIGFETYSNGRDMATLTAIPDSSRLQTGYVLQFGSQPGTLSTLVLVNAAGVSQTITMTAAIVNVLGGNPTLTTVQRTLGPNERIEAQLDQLFSFNYAQSITGYVRFQTPANSTGVFSYLQSKTMGAGLTALPAQDSGYSDVTFSHVANGTRSFTGLTLMNTGAQSSSITVDAFDSQGYATDTATLTLAPNAGWSGFLAQLLPNTNGQDGGRVHITASSLILAVQIWGSMPTGALAVVPGQGSALSGQASGQPVSALNGAVVVSPDGSTTLAVPPGALNKDTPVQITPLNAANYPQPSPNEHLVGIVEGTPDGTRFKIPVRLRFSLTENLDPGTSINLLIFNPATNQYDPSGFVATVDPSGKTASADVTHFTQFAASVASVKISNLSPGSGPAGTVVTISGSGFSLTPSLNTVSFTRNGGTTVSVTPLTASATVLTVSVPAGASSGKVYVKVGSVTSNGVRFNVTSPTNQAPVITPIADQTVTLPSGLTLSATATDDGFPNGTLSGTWSMVSGPATVTFGTPNSSTSATTGQSLTLTASTAASFSAAGTYDIRFTASDGKMSSSDDTTVTVNTPTPVNQAPVVNAGPNQTITLPSSVNLTGTATDDGLPNGTLTALWTVLTGPGTVTFADPTAFTTTATFSAAGTYTLQLQASDGQLSSTSNTTVSVSISITPAGPVVSAGANQTITLPSSATLSGTVTDSCLPTCTITTNWSMASGPGTVTFADATALKTTVAFSAAGTYTLVLNASDGIVSSNASTVVIVNPAPIGINCDLATLQNAINSSARGATINCNAGSWTWASPLNITYGIKIHGAGVGTTNITSSGLMINISPDLTSISNEETIKIDGFTFDGGNSALNFIAVHGSGVNNTKPFKNLLIGYNQFKNANTLSAGSGAIAVSGQVRGVIYHNAFDRCDTPIRAFGNDDPTEWSNGNFPFSYGSSDNLYFEDNIISFSSSYGGQDPGWIEIGQGARIVVRFNTWNMTNSTPTEYFDVHGFQNWTGTLYSGQSGSMISEYYGNTITNGAGYRWMAHRGSWGMYFDNAFTGTTNPSNGILQYNGCGNGDIYPDPAGAYIPVVNNTYGFSNTTNGIEQPFVIQLNDCGIAENVNFWNYNSAFNGTVGIGRGVLAARPATCTTGVGYWATDQGEWNGSHAGSDGQFYKCTAANTWTLYYTPYTYPHPLAIVGP